MRLLFAIPSIIKKYRIQYAHFQYIVPLYKNCRYIVTIHDVLFREYPAEFSFAYRFFKTILFRAGARRADILTTDSTFSLTSIQKFLGIQKEKIHLVPMAVHDACFEPYDKIKAREEFKAKYGFDKYILFVSRIEPRKNHASLLKAFIELELHLQGYHLVLLGHKSLHAPEFTEMMEHLPSKIRPFIFIKSDVADNGLLLFYRAADIFVYPSKAEGFGIPPLEAAAAKTPVICSNTSSMGDFTFFGKYHISPTDYDSLKEALQALISDPPGELALSAIAGTIQEKYSWARSAKQLQELIADDHGRIV
ncbi:MAG: glycosyltransferase family 4 protein [Sediminibacterium sp.]|nr:glycosyltransferase family 4 protein [Sediminibacterium sp.]